MSTPTKQFYTIVEEYEGGVPMVNIDAFSSLDRTETEVEAKEMNEKCGPGSPFSYHVAVVQW